MSSTPSYSSGYSSASDSGSGYHSPKPSPSPSSPPPILSKRKTLTPTKGRRQKIKLAGEFDVVNALLKSPFSQMTSADKCQVLREKDLAYTVAHINEVDIETLKELISVHRQYFLVKGKTYELRNPEAPSHPCTPYLKLFSERMIKLFDTISQEELNRYFFEFPDDCKISYLTKSLVKYFKTNDQYSLSRINEVLAADNQNAKECRSLFSYYLHQKVINTLPEKTSFIFKDKEIKLEEKIDALTEVFSSIEKNIQAYKIAGLDKDPSIKGFVNDPLSKMEKLYVKYLTNPTIYTHLLKEPKEIPFKYLLQHLSNSPTTTENLQLSKRLENIIINKLSTSYIDRETQTNYEFFLNKLLSTDKYKLSNSLSHAKTADEWLTIAQANESTYKSLNYAPPYIVDTNRTTYILWKKIETDPKEWISKLKQEDVVVALCTLSINDNHDLVNAIKNRIKLILSIRPAFFDEIDIKDCFNHLEYYQPFMLATLLYTEPKKCKNILEKYFFHPHDWDENLLFFLDKIHNEQLRNDITFLQKEVIRVVFPLLIQIVQENNGFGELEEEVLFNLAYTLQEKETCLSNEEFLKLVPLCKKICVSTSEELVTDYLNEFKEIKDRTITNRNFSISSIQNLLWINESIKNLANTLRSESSLTYEEKLNTLKEMWDELANHIENSADLLKLNVIIHGTTQIKVALEGLREYQNKLSESIKLHRKELRDHHQLLIALNQVPKILSPEKGQCIIFNNLENDSELLYRSQLNLLSDVIKGLDESTLLLFESDFDSLVDLFKEGFSIGEYISQLARTGEIKALESINKHLCKSTAYYFLKNFSVIQKTIKDRIAEFAKARENNVKEKRRLAREKMIRQMQMQKNKGSSATSKKVEEEETFLDLFLSKSGVRTHDGEIFGGFDFLEKLGYKTKADFLKLGMDKLSGEKFMETLLRSIFGDNYAKMEQPERKKALIRLYRAHEQLS